MKNASVLLRGVELEGQAICDLLVENGRVAALGDLRAQAADIEIDGRGGALISGLIDHHIHLLAFAAERHSVSLRSAKSPAEAQQRIAAATTRPAGTWIRATGYHESTAGPVSRADLDRFAPAHPLRVQHQTGSLWILNSRALECIGSDHLPPCVERDEQGRPTGRIWRGDAWLRARIGDDALPFAMVGAELARLGITGVTDASASTDSRAAALLADAHRRGDLPQRLLLMSGGTLAAATDDAYAVGPAKILLDEHDLPTLDALTTWIESARRWKRSVAFHSVTATELALTLAALDVVGAWPGDRIEHGGIIPETAIAGLRSYNLTVVTQPAFLFEMGDRYRADVAAAEQPDLYRCGSLIAAGIRVAASSDAPYATPDPWLGMRAAISRRSRTGHLVGGRDEHLAARRALALYLGAQNDPGGSVRPIRVGVRADLCLLQVSLAEAMSALDATAVRATLIGGAVAYMAD